MLKNYGMCYKILFAAEIILILILLSQCFRKEELEASFHNDEKTGAEIPEEGQNVFCGERLELTPGVYQVRVWAEPQEGQTIFVNMEYDSEHPAYFNSLRSNGITISFEQNYGEFEVYVSDKVPSAYVQCLFSDPDNGTAVRMDVYRTGMGNRMLFVLVMVFFTVMDLLIWFRRRILEGRVAGRQQAVFWTLTAGVLLACFPLFTDYVICGEDTGFYMSRIAHLADSLGQGVHPMQLYYTDFFLLIPVLVRLAGFPVMTAYKSFVFLVTAATAVTTYNFIRKCVKDEYAALFGSMIYLLDPYRLSCVYDRGKVSEYFTMIFLPPVCCGIYLLFDTAQRYGKGSRERAICRILGTAGIILIPAVWQWFCYGGTGLEAGNMAGAGITALFLFYVLWQYKQRNQDWFCSGYAILGAAALLMSTDGFSWNFMALSVLSAAFLGALMFLRVRNEGGNTARAALVIIAVFIIASAVYCVNRIVFEAEPVWLYSMEKKLMDYAAYAA